jgi:hypothetical protein
MLATTTCATRGALSSSRRPSAHFLSKYNFPNRTASGDDHDIGSRIGSVVAPYCHCSARSVVSSAPLAASTTAPPTISAFPIIVGGGSRGARGGGGGGGAVVVFRSFSSFSALPPDEENREKSRVGSLTPYQKEMELRTLDSELARLQTLRGINTGELYTFRGKFKMLSRDYGMGFMAWYWTVWFGTAGLSYAAIELGGVDPMMVAAKIETFMGWEATYLSGKLDPTLGQIGLVVAVNECLEPLRLPFVVVTTKPVVNFFSKH